MQTSESFRLSAVLAFSGGFQDAYTYNMRDHVFANAQTGNVVLMSQNFMQGNAVIGVHYMFPLLQEFLLPSKLKTSSRTVRAYTGDKSFCL